MRDYTYKRIITKEGEPTIVKEVYVSDEVVKQIKSDVIDEFARELHKGCNEMIKQTWGSNTAPISWAEAYANFKEDIDEIAEQLKEGKA